MVFEVITLFPEMFASPLSQGIIKRALDKNLIKINLHNLRDWAIDKRGSVDDKPYGGGVGMILRVEPIFFALQSILQSDPINRNKESHQTSSCKIILLDPKGTKFTQTKAQEYAGLEKIVLICGRYEGIDERVRLHLVDESISIGDYVLTGGEIPAMVIIDSVTRLIPGVLTKPEAVQNESFSLKSEGNASFLEFPQYTRPAEFNGWKVPSILLSGNHQEIKKWQKNNLVKY